jgi:putative phosphoesterase
VKKIAIISDIHGNIAALEKVVEDIKKQGVDQIVNLGDYASGPLWAKETIQFLMQQDWINIRGNHDRQLIAQAPEQHGPSDRFAFQSLSNPELDWLRQLPPQAELMNEFLFVHGTPQNDMTYLLETVEHGSARLATRKEISERIGKVNHRIILCGHTHIPRVLNLSDQVMIVNPGSVGLQAYEDNTPVHHVMETGSPLARYALLEKADDQWNVKLIAISYDHHSAAEQARKNGRFGWEHALRTGFMSIAGG